MYRMHVVYYVSMYRSVVDIVFIYSTDTLGLSWLVGLFGIWVGLGWWWSLVGWWFLLY